MSNTSHEPGSVTVTFTPSEVRAVYRALRMTPTPRATGHWNAQLVLEKASPELCDW
jgi:hypothetical protein